MKSFRGIPVKAGILGGGQLARLLALAAYPLGIEPHIFSASRQDSAAQVAPWTHDDGSARSLLKFASRMEFLVLENEFIDLKKLQRLESAGLLKPSVNCLRKVQNKAQQKRHLLRYKISTLPAVFINDVSGFIKAREEFGSSLVIKAAQLGYDGRGTHIFAGRNKFDPLEFARRHPDFQGYAEPLVTFKKELAVVVSRSTRGELKTFPLIETFQIGGMCHWAVAPAAVGVKHETEADRLARKVIERFGGVGTFGVEMFLLSDGQIVVNEIAPRVHNSGHLTMNACRVSQFEQHWRAVMGGPLAPTDMIYPAAAMVNIIGQRERVTEGLVSSAEFSWIHWYGKQGKMLERKLGHVNAVGSSIPKALQRARSLRKRILV